MGKRIKQTGWKGALAGAAVTMGMLIVTIAILAALIHKRIIRSEGLRYGLLVCCLVSGTVGALSSTKAEGRVRIFMACAAPSVILITAAVLLSPKETSILGVIPYAASLLISSALTQAVKGNSHKGSARGRKTRRRMKAR